MGTFRLPQKSLVTQQKQPQDALACMGWHMMYDAVGTLDPSISHMPAAVLHILGVLLQPIILQKLPFMPQFEARTCTGSRGFLSETLSAKRLKGATHAFSTQFAYDFYLSLQTLA